MAADTSLEILNRDDVRALLQDRSDPAVSIYLPVERAVAKAEQNAVRLKNLVARAEQRLARAGCERAHTARLLEPVRGLVADRGFWSNRRDGLAILRTTQRLRCYWLPFRVEELVAVGDRPHVRPLLQALSAGERFYVLALSQNSLRLLEATRYGFEEVDLAATGAPASLADALRYDDFEKTNLQHHPGATKSGRGTKMFHGHGPGSEDLKEEISRYFHAADVAISKVTDDHAPLVLAGVDYLHPLYRQASRHRNIVPDGIVGNPEQLSSAQLHARALEVVKPHLRAGLEAARARYSSLEGTGLASCALEDVLRAAHEGRVESLFVRKGVEVWGRYDVFEGKAEIDDGGGGDELLDVAAAQTLEHAGNVHLVPDRYMPCSEALAAIFRY